MFRSRLRSVVPMDHRYLAENDGSEFAEGRGSGKDIDPASDKKPRGRTPIPYMHMTYAPAERRLDTAIFRALFASSARQARQFVVHGAVKVNGKKVANSFMNQTIVTSNTQIDDIPWLPPEPRRYVSSRP